MLRVLAPLSLLAFLLWSCGPDVDRTCSGAAPAFQVVLRLMARPLPEDIVVRVLYGGSAREEFRLSDPKALHEVTFCKVADEKGVPIDPSAPDASGSTGAAGAAGVTGAGGAASDAGGSGPAVVQTLFCQLYTAGWTELKITGSGFEPVTCDLSPRGRDECTVTRDITLDLPDAGS